MRCLAAATVAAGFCLAGCLVGVPAHADVVIAINKSKQRMAVLVDGVQRYVWKVSTGLRGAPKTGTYHPQRLEKTWFSHKYGMSPMPYSIFFHEGFAIHGTIYVSRLGRRASHGCVRLLPANAAILFDLVRSRPMSSTTIIVSNEHYVAPKPVPVQVDATVFPAPSGGPDAAPAASNWR